MKKFILYISILFFATLLWFFSFNRGINREEYLSEKVLAKTTPLNATIDVDFVKSLNSAYE